ncbi:uncharacterized protein LOC129788746 [Lutzomyia longipalpis]|uniref:uncharacterized protein LOC129788746 n=1 Tax=Lutzomyia longipalpis TaxID=7200 RepID=UPI002483497C|nr:uncharacterized protein LOC129788746 [Lutzomyia longipalpis]XP_055681042.1 uncharacterized protein LOC129788746 [Lutzomyia longipalpis]
MYLRSHRKRKMELQAAEEIGKKSFREGEDSILRLNDDCLCHIFSFLNLQDLMVAEEVCTRFEAVAQQMYKFIKKLDFATDLQNDITSPKAIKAACRVGSYVSSIKVVGFEYNNKDIKDKVDFSQFLRMYFTNLQKVVLGFLDIQKCNECITNLAVAFKEVKEVELYSCKIPDNNLKILFQIDQLEVFQCYYDDILDGTFMEGLTRNIRQITMCGCYNVKSEKFKKFCREHPNLKSLNICSYGWINKTCLSTIAEHLKELETLQMSDSYYYVSSDDYAVLADLPMLKHFKNLPIPGNSLGNCNLLLQQICKHNQLESLAWRYRPIALEKENETALRKLTKLKELNVSDSTWLVTFSDSTLDSLSTCLEYLHIYESRISLEHLEKFIKKCKFLKLLNVPFCQDINENFILRILPHLKERSHMLELVICQFKTLDKISVEFRRTYIGINSSKLMITFE